MHQDDAGVWQVKTTGKQGSGILRSMSLANAFIILEHERSSVKAGEMVTVQPFSGCFNLPATRHGSLLYGCPLAQSCC